MPLSRPSSAPSITWSNTAAWEGRCLIGPVIRLLVVPRTYDTVVYRLIRRSTHPRIEIMRIEDQRRQRR